MAVSRCRRQQAWQKRSNPNANPNTNLNANPNANPKPKRNLWKVLKKGKKIKREVDKVRVELKSNGIPDVKHNRSTPIE